MMRHVTSLLIIAAVLAGALWYVLSLPPSSSTSTVMDDADAASRREVLFRQEFVSFGTVAQIAMRTSIDNGEAAMRDIQARFHDINRDFHAWEPGGVVAEINDAIAAGRPITISADVAEVLRRATELAVRGEHTFNPAIGGLVALWGFHGEQWSGPPPSRQAIARYTADMPEMTDITITADNVLTSNNRLVRIDLGAIAKGYAVAEAIRILRSHGISNAVVNIGGDVQVIGKKAPQLPWQVAILGDDDETIGTIAARDGEAFFTSGQNQRFYLYEGKRYGHIIDPTTGYPVEHVRVASVIANDAMVADAAATALFVGGRAQFTLLAQRYQLIGALLVDEQGQLTYGEMADRLTKDDNTD